MTPLPLIQDQSVIAFPYLNGTRTDAATVSDGIFAEVFAALDATGLRVRDLWGDASTELPFVPAAVGEQPEGDDTVMGDVALFATMMHQAKAGVILPEPGDPLGDPQVVDAALLGLSETHLYALGLICDPDATDIPVDLDKIAAFLLLLMQGDASGADTALSFALSKGVPPEAGVVLDPGAPLEAGFPSETGDGGLANSNVGLALMQVDGHLTIMLTGAPGLISGEISSYSNAIGPVASAPEQTTAQTAPPVGAKSVALAQASTSSVVTAAMVTILPEVPPLSLRGQMRTTSVLAPALLEKPSMPVASGVPGAITREENNAPFAEPVGNSTLKPGISLTGFASSSPEIRIADLLPGAEVAAPVGGVLRDGGTSQLVSPDAWSKKVGALTSLPAPQATPADQGSFPTAPVLPEAKHDEMYPDIVRPNVLSSAPLLIAANMKTGRMRSLEQAGSQPFDQRSGLVPHLLPGSEMLGAQTADQGRSTVARIARVDAPVNTMKDLKQAAVTYDWASGRTAGDVAGSQVTQSGTQAPAVSTGAVPSAAPVAQNGILPAMLDVRRQGWTRTLVQRAADMAQSGGILTLKILPQHLGQITLKMSEGRRGFDLRIITEVPSTAAMLRGVESQISSAFEGAGLLLGEFSANSGKGGGSAFGADGNPVEAAMSDATETDAGISPDDTAEQSLLNIML